jgi:hypothetical protein
MFSRSSDKRISRVGLLACLPLLIGTGGVLDHQTAFLEVRAISPNRSIPVVANFGTFLISSEARFARSGSRSGPGSNLKTSHGWTTDTDFGPSVEIDSVRIPIISNDPARLQTLAPMVFSALGGIPLLGMSGRGELTPDDFAGLEPITIDVFTNAVFVYGPPIPTVVLKLQNSVPGTEVSGLDVMTMRLPHSSIHEIEIASGRLYIHSSQPGSYSDLGTYPTKDPLLIWDDFGNLVAGSGWKGPRYDSFEVSNGDLVVYSNVGFLGGRLFSENAIDCGSKNNQVSLVDPVSKEPLVMQFRASFEYDSNELSPKSLSMEVYSTASFDGDVASCRWIPVISEYQGDDYGGGRWNSDRTKWTFSGTREGYLEESVEISRRYWRHIADLLNAENGPKIQIGPSLKAVLTNADSCATTLNDTETTLVELGAIGSDSAAEFFALFSQ